VDIDRYLLQNQPGWDRLAELSGRARWHRSSLAAPEIDELVALYQRTSAQLSHVRTTYRDPEPPSTGNGHGRAAPSAASSPTPSRRRCGTCAASC
jgi:hypothetical protein